LNGHTESKASGLADCSRYALAVTEFLELVRQSDLKSRGKDVLTIARLPED